MITYRATLDVPAGTLRAVTAWLRAHRKAHDTRPWQRAATVYVQAVMVLRWFKDATDIRLLARDGGVSVATGYRYLHEANRLTLRLAAPWADWIDRFRG